VQVTVGYEHPNAYPSVLMVKPSPPWGIRQRHPHVDTQGVCYLLSITSWNPQRSNLRGVFDDAIVCFQRDYPLEQNLTRYQPPPGRGRAGSSSQAMPQPTSQQQQQPQTVPSLEVQIAGMAIAAGVSAVRALGSAITGPSETQGEAQRERDMKWLAEQKKREEAARNETPEQMAYIGELFKALLSGASKREGTVIVCPRGFGVNSVRVTSLMSATVPGQRGFLMLVEGCPYPLQACVEPTPKEQFEVYLQQKEDSRQKTRDKDISEKSGFGKAMGMLSKGATYVTAGYSAVERKVWDDHTDKGAAYFKKKFPTLQDQFVEAYGCSTTTGEGRLVKGTLHIARRNICFTATEGDHCFVVPLGSIVSLVRGQAVDTQWLLAIMGSGHIATFSDFTSYLGSIATIMSGLTGTSADRAYNWMDHMWRAGTAVPVPGYPYGDSCGGASPSQQQNAGPPPPIGVTVKQKESTEAMQCVVCMDAPRNAFFQPCGHMVSCMRCSATLKNICPMCRAEILQVFTAFT